MLDTFFEDKTSNHPCGYPGEQICEWWKKQSPELHEAPWDTSWPFLQRNPWLPLCSGSPGVQGYTKGGVGATRGCIDYREFKNEHRLKVVSFYYHRKPAILALVIKYCHREYFSNAHLSSAWGVMWGSGPDSHFCVRAAPPQLLRVLAANGSELPPSLESYTQPSLSSSWPVDSRPFQGQIALRESKAFRVLTSTGHA